MTDMERYALLATLRTGEHISNHERELRWYFLRMIMTRAYISSYHRTYSVDREWNECIDTDIDNYHRVVSYDMEMHRLLILIEHIKTYTTPKKIKEGFTPDTAAVALAIKAYYFRFIQYDVTLLLEQKGIAFEEHDFFDYQPIRRKHQRYSRILELDRYLRQADWDVHKALITWVQDKNSNYDRYMNDPDVHTIDRNNIRPTPAMILGMYARMLRHAAVVAHNSATSLESLVDEDDKVYPLEDCKSGVRALYDIGFRYKELTKEVNAISRTKRKHDYY